ncbi:hypothetical protein [Paenibacillus lutrae]|uniref:Uncharacterized protein n=1 Tax=Paenibacillus lutrae TaxID=2078573 RepID=A0A7X3JZL1_9BACL|nr:hypothetical protein [Paenibacillus lutrae]
MRSRKITQRKEPLSHNSYEQLFVEFSDRVERMLFRLVGCVLVLLIFSQLLLQAAPLRSIMTRVDPLEGDPYVRHSQKQQR